MLVRKAMQTYLHSLQSSMLDLAQNPNLPIFIATFAGISVACFAVGFLYMLRKTPLPSPTKPSQPAGKGFGRVPSSA
jgi:hypothetical protein